MGKDLNSIILSKMELKIMKVVWDRREVKVKDVLNVLSQTRKLAYTTISTEMEILEKKGVLVKSKKGITNFYKPLLSHRQAMTNHLKYLIKYLFDGNPEELLEFVFQNMYELKDLPSIMHSKCMIQSSKRLN